jgi:hypothetical protein
VNITWAKADSRWYLGVRCRKCRLPILFALDRSDGTEDVKSFSAEKLVLTCTLEKCRHKADYTGATIMRFQKPPATEKETARKK